MKLGIGYGSSFSTGDRWEFAILPTITLRKTTDIEDVMTENVTYQLRLIWLFFIGALTLTYQRDWL
jgi:hypothetical protein